MKAYSPLKAKMILCGYRVVEDPDQPGMYLWRFYNLGSDTSFPTEDAAWEDAAKDRENAIKDGAKDYGAGD